MCSKNIWFSFLLGLLVLATFTQCSKEMEEEAIWDGGPHLSMGFEDPNEPFELIPNREVNASDTANGCLPSYLWNDQYVYNVCVSPTRELSDFSIGRSFQHARMGLSSLRFFLRPTPVADWPLGEATHRAVLGYDRVVRAAFEEWPLG